MTVPESVCRSKQHRVVTKPESAPHQCKLLEKEKANHVTQYFVCKMTSNQLGFIHCLQPSDLGGCSDIGSMWLGHSSQPAWMPGPYSAFHFRLYQSVQHQVSRLRFPRGGWWQVYRSPGAYLARHLLHLRSMFFAWGSDFLRRGRRDQVGPDDQPFTSLSTLAF